MGMFRKSDELFEIMSKRKGGNSAPLSNPSPTTTRRARRFGAPAMSWRYGRTQQELPDLLEVDGEAVVLVEDGWSDGLVPLEEEAPKTYTVRSDTLVVGGFLCLGLLVASFLLGRQASDEPQAAEAKTAEVATASAEPGATQNEESAKQTAKPNPKAKRRTTSVPAGFRPAERKAKVKPASTKPSKKLVKGKFVLIICKTTPDNGKKLAEWFNTNTRSPIFGRTGLKATNSRGSVRIHGFKARDARVKSLVRNTYDPLGGPEPFSSAYFIKAR